MFREYNSLDIVLVDWGLSTELGCPREKNLCGTPGNIAPEMFDLSQQSHPKGDIFGLGVTLHYILTHKHLFEGTGY